MGTRVDIAIPTHGDASFLAEAVGSVLAQTHGELTVRVSDNGPGGGAAARVAEALGDPRLEYTATGGVPIGENWTRCLRSGTAPYVAVLPHDERFEPGWVAERVAFLDAHPECAFVFGSLTVIDGAGRLIARPHHEFAEGVLAREAFVPALYARNCVQPSTLLIRRSALEAAGAHLREDMRMADDWELFFRMAVRAPVGYLAVRDSHARWHADTETARARRWGEMHLAVARRFDELIAQEMPGFALPAGLRERRVALSHLMVAVEALDEGRPDVARAHVRAAARLRPATLLHARGLAALAGAYGGARARQVIGAVRAFEGRQRVRFRAAELARGLA